MPDKFQLLNGDAPNTRSTAPHPLTTFELADIMGTLGGAEGYVTAILGHGIYPVQYISKTSYLMGPSGGDRLTHLLLCLGNEIHSSSKMRPFIEHLQQADLPIIVRDPHNAVNGQFHQVVSMKPGRDRFGFITGHLCLDNIHFAYEDHNYRDDFTYNIPHRLFPSIS